MLAHVAYLSFLNPPSPPASLDNYPISLIDQVQQSKQSLLRNRIFRMHIALSGISCSPWYLNASSLYANHLARTSVGILPRRVQETIHSHLEPIAAIDWNDGSGTACAAGRRIKFQDSVSSPGEPDPGNKSSSSEISTAPAAATPSSYAATSGSLDSPSCLTPSLKAFVAS